MDEAEYLISLTLITKHQSFPFLCNNLPHTYYALVYWPTKIVIKHYIINEQENASEICQPIEQLAAELLPVTVCHCMAWRAGLLSWQLYFFVRHKLSGTTFRHNPRNLPIIVSYSDMN